jgi:hypothetical protein
LLTVDEPFEQIGNRIEDKSIDRIIIACQNRWDYPCWQLQQLAISFPEVPIALAIGDWWMGWRRTGIGHQQILPHISLPWYRWWDGWIQWLDGALPTMFGPFPTERMAVAYQPECSARAWELASQDNLVESKKPLDSILWDDSQLETWLGWEKSLILAIEQLVEIQTRNPRAKLWIAWTLPTWELVSRLNQAGLNYELLAKPYFSRLSSAALART